MALFDDLSKKAAKLTEKTIEKSSELADVAKTRVSIKSAQADLDEKFIELGKLYYERQQQSFRKLTVLIHE